MKNIFNIRVFALFVFAAILFTACNQPSGDNPGSEYMPDMGRSIAYDANLYYYYYNNTWNDQSVKKLKTLSMPGKPLPGTMPRGWAGISVQPTADERAEMMAAMTGQTQKNAISIPLNGYVPFYYEDSDAGRDSATKAIIQNPLPITAAGLEQGKALYEINCGICHGAKGDGVGWLVDEKNLNAKYPAQPANLIQGDLLTASNGRYYYAIMYGKNVMGGYADKLGYEERWNVIHYIRQLQAKATGAQYDEMANTMNTIEIPGSKVASMAELIKKHSEKNHVNHATDHDHGAGDHGHGGNHGHGSDGHDHGTTDHGHESGDHGHDDGHNHGSDNHDH